MITKSAALDRFITERVMGDRGFGYNGKSCVYDKDVNGGCEIGQYIQGNILDGFSGGCSTGPVLRAMREADFEEPESPFWPLLQSAHDNLAIFVADDGGLSWNNWVEFSKNIKEALVYVAR